MALYDCARIARLALGRKTENAPAGQRMSWFLRNLRCALKGWLVTVNQELIRQTALLDSRVEAIAVSKPKPPNRLIEVEGDEVPPPQDRGYRWTRWGPIPTGDA